MYNNRKTIVAYATDGTQKTFAFPMDYLKRAYIYAYIEDGVTYTYETDYTITDKQLEFTKAPPAGSTLVIYRETSTDRLVAWEDASVLGAGDMTLNQVQLFHLIEEARDRAGFPNVIYPDGTGGSIWYSGIGSPSESLGTSLDYYLNTATGDVYSKITGQWVKIMTLGSGSSGGTVIAASAYNTIADLKADTTLTAGMRVSTLGYYEVDDDGGAEYIIVDETELGWAEALDNGLFALINERERVTYRMFGAYLDGEQDDGTMMVNCHKYADSIFTYDQTGLIKVYHCRVENHSGIIYKQGTDAINCNSDVDLSGSTLLVDDTNATWYGIYVWGDVNSLYYDWEPPGDVKEYFKADNFVFPMTTGQGEALPANTVLKLEEDPYSARDDSGYLYTVARRELVVHDMNGICSSPLSDDWDHAGGEEINCKISNLSQGTTETMQAFSTLRTSFTYIPDKHGTFTGCDVLLNMSANKYCTVMWCKRHNATVQNFIFRPRVDALHNTAFKNTMVYIWDSYNVTVRNLQGFNASGQKSGTSNGTSGYMLRLTNCSDVTIEDCRMQGYWGVTAMDSVKNIRVHRCHLNRLDTHDYFKNLWVDECTFYNSSIQIGYGRGLCSVNNSNFYWNPIDDLSYPSSHIIEFNCTYGRIFEGKIHVENCRVVTKTPPDNEFNIFKMEFSPNATSIIKHFQFPQITVKNVDVQSSESDTHYAYFKVVGTRNAATSDTAPTHVYNISNDGSVVWQYYGRGVNWGEDETSIEVDGILRVSDTFLDENKKTKFYNIRFYRCTQAGTLSFSGSKPTTTSSTEFTCGSAKLVYAPDVLWKSKWSYAVDDICAVSQSNWYPLTLFRCVSAGVSNGSFPTHTSGTVLEGTNDSVSEPDSCWWTYVAKTADWCIDWQENMTVTNGERIVVVDRLYEVVQGGQLPELPPYDTYWFGEHTWGTARLKYIGAVHKPQAWFALGSYCVARDNVYQLANHDGTTSGVYPTRGNPYCVDGDIIWKYVSGDNIPTNPTDPEDPTDPEVPTEGVAWQANTEYADGTFIQVGTHIYEVQQATTGTSNPTDTSGNILMDGERRIQFLFRTKEEWRQQSTYYDVGYICWGYEVGTSNVNVFAQVIQAGTTADSGWGPVADAAWSSDGTFVDGSVIWKKIATSGVWRNNTTKYPSGMIYLTDVGEETDSDYVRLYMSLGGLSGTTAPTDTSGTEFKNGTLILKYVGESDTSIDPEVPDEKVEWQANTEYADGTIITDGTHLYEAQQATTGTVAPTDTSGDIIMDGERRVQFLFRPLKAEVGRQQSTYYDVGHVCYAYGDGAINIVAQVIQAGTTAASGSGPVAGAAWSSEGTFIDGTVIWKRISTSGVWRAHSTKYPSGTVYLSDTNGDGALGYVRLYMSLGGVSDTTAPTDTSGDEFKNGTLILKYIGEVETETSTTTTTTDTTTLNASTMAEGDTWLPNTMYNVGDTVISNGNTYECVFDGKLVMPSKTIFESITTNMNDGHVFWFYKGTDIPTKLGNRDWELIVKHCEGIDPTTAEGVTGDTPYFCHSGNPNPTIRSE